MTSAPPHRAAPVLLSADAVGGVWTWAADLACGLAAEGTPVVLAVLGPAPSPAQRAAVDRDGIDLRLTGAPLDWTARDPREVDDAGRILAALARETGAGLVHLHAPALAATAPFDVPVAVTVHSCLATWWAAMRGDEPLPSDFRWRIAQTREGLARADRVTAPTRAFAEAVASAYGVPPPRVVPNGRARPTRALARREPFAFTAGRLWDEAKNVAAIDRAAAELDVPVLAAGPVEAPHGGRAAFPSLRLLGPLAPDAVADHMSRAAVYVSAARYEPFGLSVLEAAGAGAALVLSAIPVFRELWTGAALFVAPNDHLDIAASVDMLLADDALRRRLTGAARQKAGALDVAGMIAATRAVHAQITAPDRGREACA